MVGTNITHSNIIDPCRIVDIFDLAPAEIFAEVLTTTDVSGKPPIIPDTILPIPCAFSSLLVGVTLFNGSSLSAASIPNKVSRLATMANVIPDIHTSGFFKNWISGKVKNEKNAPTFSATGKVTRCFCSKA